MTKIEKFVYSNLTYTKEKGGRRMRFSVSRVGCYGTCPYQFKLRYIDGLQTLPNYDDPANALILGSALHKGIETSTEEGVKLYFDSFPVVTDKHLDEAIKLRHWIPKVKELLPANSQHEVEIADGERFVGYIDLLADNGDGTFDIYDFKYSNNIDHYMESPQLHVYKYYCERLTGKKIRKLFFMFVPKIAIRQKQTETVQTFRNRLMAELQSKEIKIKEIPFDRKKVDGFFMDIVAIEDSFNYEKRETRLCDWCEFQQYCKEGIDYMILPKNERRKPESVTKTRLWIYGAPFSGKTTLADKFPEPLMLNTDGNAECVTAPYIRLKDVVEVNGRITNTTLAWEVFKDTIAELAKNQNDFKTIVVDLVEDMYESCRLYMYKQMGITHESDDSFRAWDKVRTEFLSTMRELMNLDYENIILISHEDTSKDITKRSGDKITSIRPNIAEKIANKLAGMVQLVIRCVVIDGKYLLSFKSDEVVFGGGRIKINSDNIPNDYATLSKLINAAEKARAEKAPEEKPERQGEKQERQEVKPEQQEVPTKDEVAVQTELQPAESSAPVRRTRRTRRTS